MLPPSPTVSRVVVVVLDGLRADAIPLFPLPQLRGLAVRGAWTTSARTVLPSVTAAALTSLVAGVHPVDHGIEGDRFGLPRPRLPLTPLPALLGAHELPVRGFFTALPRVYRGFAERAVRRIGATVTFDGTTADDVLENALSVLGEVRRGLFLLHWPDADRAGHAHGWDSPEYLAAARRLDHAFGQLVRRIGALDDDGTLVIALADHGGGGAVANDHDSTHPLDTTIPMLLLGGAVMPGPLPAGVSLLDVPATVAWALGLTPPASYAGRPLAEAFHRLPAWVRRGARPLIAAERAA